MRRTETTLAAVGVVVALIALIPAFGQWLFPRHADPADGLGATLLHEPAASPAPASMLLPDTLSIPAGAALGGIATPEPEPPFAPSAQITYPEDGAIADKIVMVKGSISPLSSGQRAYLCVRSTAFGRLIFPQGEVLPDANGSWSVRAIYASIGYKYQTFVATAATKEAAQSLGDGYNRSYGMPNLPEGSSIVGPIVTVERR